MPQQKHPLDTGTKIVWQNGQPLVTPSTLHADDAAGKFKRISQSHQPSHHYRCQFCAWLGPYDDYYAHWRVNHRTRAGHTHIEVPRRA